MKKLSLKSTKIISGHEDKIRKCIIMLHGYGGDGKDISTLAYSWQRHLKDTLIICPDGHEECSISPSGRQWFDLSKDKSKYILEQSIISEKKLLFFIDELKNLYNLKNNDICLVGFSQGCMISLNIAFNPSQEFACVIGFSGKIINKDYLSKRLNNRTKVFLIHGDSDTIVQPNYLLEAKDFFLRNKIKIKTKIVENCGHNISVEASSVALEYIKENF